MDNIEKMAEEIIKALDRFACEYDEETFGLPTFMGLPEMRELIVPVIINGFNKELAALRSAAVQTGWVKVESEKDLPKGDKPFFGYVESYANDELLPSIIVNKGNGFYRCVGIGHNFSAPADRIVFYLTESEPVEQGELPGEKLK